MSTEDKKIPGKDAHKTSMKDSAIDKKSNDADGRKINEQVKDKREQHQPRDNA
ncbi:hypothetical protein [Rasiella sp. SM2506]|uniref:hypothetical protein n=1 Tax=Rasiella sp. SM2506 TaxID=3423914 RepID=UPI003D7935F2